MKPFESMTAQDPFVDQQRANHTLRHVEMLSRRRDVLIGGLFCSNIGYQAVIWTKQALGEGTLKLLPRSLRGRQGAETVVT